MGKEDTASARSVGPTSHTPVISMDAARALAGQICAAAAIAAEATCRLLELVGEFDATDAVLFQDGCGTTARWLAWACSMSPGTAREHVRIARAMRGMPRLTQLFREGRLSYSKMRAATRLSGLVDEAGLCDLAETMTAAQLDVTVAGYRSSAGTRLRAEDRRRMSWIERDGLVSFSLHLPTEEAAVVIAALETARDRQPVAERSTVDAMLDVARAYLDCSPADESGEDRTFVVVHVGAETLAEATPAPTHGPAEPGRGEPVGGDVPAGASSRVCHIPGVGPVEPATAAKLSCDAVVLGAIVDAHGDVLALGRTRRLVSKAQRRALMVRDRMCQFPACHRTRHLHAHHIVSWSRGGPTDLANLMLLCETHHTFVHEGGLLVSPTGGYLASGQPGWKFTMPDGRDVRQHHSWGASDDALRWKLQEHAERATKTLAGVHSMTDPAADKIVPGWRGEPFSIHDCVLALFDLASIQERNAMAHGQRNQEHDQEHMAVA